ncbi:cytochrome P450 [Nocardia salmonicida]|uniref:cytochrome P450 n=1 Tax=Nocardia salmonicida TaxID=53431 RepID=UPI00366A681B
MLSATANAEPFDWYADARARAPIVWEEEMSSWVVVSYEAVREICRLDNIGFRRKDAEQGSEYDVISGGRRNVKVLTGEQHAKLHSWMMSAFTPAKASGLQESIVRDVVRQLIDRLSGKNTAELKSELLDQIPIRVVAAVLDLPWDDDDWVEQATDKVQRIFNFYGKRGYHDATDVEDARLAHVEMRALMDPVLTARSDGSGADLISRFFAAGPEILDDWNIEDVYINTMSFFLGGAHTSTLVLASAFYLMLTDQALLARMRECDDKTLRAFVEQVLRLHPPQQFTQRRVIDDIEICGVQLRKGDLITLAVGATNRDESHYPRPDEIDFEQRNQRDHLTFLAGPHACVGQGLARAEIVETVRQVLARFADIRLNPEALEPPRYQGLIMRGYSPLHVVYRLAS